MGDNNSDTASHASNKSVNIQGSIESRILSQTPTQNSSPSLFPPQRNNLLSWMKSLPEGPPSPARTPRSHSNASPSPFRPIENLVPSTPVQFIREASPALATPPRASVPATLASPPTN